jgi:hypothetical protein
MDQNAVRETWYYPESAYWVTFDNSIPLLLLPYLDARWRDIQTVEAMGIPGHVTFSSGWEWGYWLVDWSIARWSWEYAEKGQRGEVVLGRLQGPYRYLLEFFPEPTASEIMVAIADSQITHLKEHNLLRWLCPSSPADELPPPMNKQFQPRGIVNLGDLSKLARESPEKLGTLPCDSLERYAQELLYMLALIRETWEDQKADIGYPDELALEILSALEVTAYRAQHAADLMKAVANWQRLGGKRDDLRSGLQNAAWVRLEAQKIVQTQEARYRYPVDHLTGQYRNHTAYDFGYLHTVHNLHFWEREEQQILRGRHGPFFMNIYDLAKIAGLKD